MVAEASDPPGEVALKSPGAARLPPSVRYAQNRAQNWQDILHSNWSCFIGHSSCVMRKQDAGYRLQVQIVNRKS